MEQKKRAAVLLRFQTDKPTPTSTAFRTYASISRNLKMPYSTVRMACVQSVGLSTTIASRRKKRRAKPVLPNEEQIDFLVSNATLGLWAGYSLLERAALFHRRFADCKITPSTLRAVYHKFGIKKKKVVLVKRTAPLANQRWPTTERDIVRQIEASDREGRILIFCDEVMFTKHTNQARDWSRMHHNIEVEQKKAFTAYRSVIVAISADMGVSNWTIYDRGVCTDDFLEFLRDLRRTHGDLGLTVFLDNLGAHRANADVDELAELDIRLIFNIADSPQYNPIETVFAEVKVHFKKHKLHKLRNGIWFDIDDAIEAALDQVPVEHSSKYIEHCLRVLRDNMV
jgi:hypothetical protein